MNLAKVYKFMAGPRNLLGQSYIYINNNNINFFIPEKKTYGRIQYKSCKSKFQLHFSIPKKNNENKAMDK